MWPVLYASQALLLRWLLISISLVSLSGSEQRGAKYIHTPMHEIAQTELYLTINDNHEVIVSYAGKGVDLRPNDYITHADGVRILTGKPGGLEEFLRSGEKEAVVPIVDDDDTKFGGQRLKGFMLLQAVQPRKLVSRRGEVFYDMEEGGPAPSMKLGEGAKEPSCMHHMQQTPDLYSCVCRQYCDWRWGREDDDGPQLRASPTRRRRLHQPQGLLPRARRRWPHRRQLRGGSVCLRGGLHGHLLPGSFCR